VTRGSPWREKIFPRSALNPLARLRISPTAGNPPGPRNCPGAAADGSCPRRRDAPRLRPSHEPL